MSMSLSAVLDDLRAFVYAEQEAGMVHLYEIWEKPLDNKLYKGETQQITSLEYIGNGVVKAILGDNESKFREGDMICLHPGDVFSSELRQVVIEAEDDGYWLLRGKLRQDKVAELKDGCYADPDSMDLTSFYEKALSDVATSKIGREVLLPLLNNQLNTDVLDHDRFDDVANDAQDLGLNEKQCEAVGLGVAAKYLACIQGPPGTGKTKVISLIARLLVEAGERVLMTSHTHMAINNALNKIAEEKVPVAKVCALGGRKALHHDIPCFDYGNQWEDKPDNGYVIGATPFATCSERLEQFEFDTVIFDEASQITMPLALMAMRKAKRYVFVGDDKQLPPVILSQSVLKENSAFSKIAGDTESHVLLAHTYRMSEALTQWPSKRYYNGELVSKRSPQRSVFHLAKPPTAFVDVLASEHPFVFIPTPGINARSVNLDEAKLVAEILASAIEAGLPADEIGIVTPFRGHAKALRRCLANKLGVQRAKSIVTDTVERMQGQEREMIIVSMCSSDPQYIQAIAEFFFQSERLNVAVTRPQTKLILLGPEISSKFVDSLVEEKARDSAKDYCSLVSHGYRVEV